MQVVVLAGGIGSRLKPWTNSMPKPLLPMLDRTLLEQVIYSMPSKLVDEVIVAGGYKVDMIKSHFDSINCDFDITIVNETDPLGTGGALGNCRDYVTGTFACFNGDIISSLDISELLNLHKNNGGIGSLGLWEVADPTRFGIVGIDDNNKVTKFKEKPIPTEVFSKLINAGSYIFEEEIFEHMPQGKHSLERAVFPKLAESRLLNGMQFHGYFIDAGTKDSWNQAVSKCISESRFTKGVRYQNSWFGSAAQITDKTNVTESMVDVGCNVETSTIVKSTILTDSIIGANCIISDSLIGQNCRIGNNCVIENAIVANHSVIPNGTNIIGNTWPIE